MCGPGGMWVGMVPMTLFWEVVLGIVIWLIFQLIGRGRAPGGETGRSRAEEILNERYGRGEIDRENLPAHAGGSQGRTAALGRAKPRGTRDDETCPNDRSRRPSAAGVSGACGAAADTPPELPPSDHTT